MANTKPKRILVIEDERDIAALVAMHLKDHHFQVELALDGHQGERLALAESWDLIILDLCLPGTDGLSICRHLRQNAPYLPVLMLTSKTSELDRVLGLELGADDYMTKPFSVTELIARVKAIIASCGCPRQAANRAIAKCDFGRFAYRQAHS